MNEKARNRVVNRINNNIMKARHVKGCIPCGLSFKKLMESLK